LKRKLLLAFCAVLASAMLAGCGKSGGDSDESRIVNVYNWGEYIDEQLLEDFEDETGIHVNYQTFDTNESMRSILKQGGSDYDVIVPSDYMISRLIEEDMLEKIDFNNIPNISLIDESFKGMEFDPTGEYSVPYMWGTVGIIYNTTMVDEPVDSWEILFDEKYSGQILMFDNSRDAMGIALKYLGYSLNTTSDIELDQAFELLETQKPLLQAYVMDQIFDKLAGGEAAIGPYYAGDYVTMVQDNPDLAFVIPKEGTNRFVDSMCIPKGAGNKENAEAFINFMCSTKASTANSDVVGYASPNTEVRDSLDLDDETMDVMYPSEDILANCEYFINLPQDTLDAYDNYWIKLKA